MGSADPLKRLNTSEIGCEMDGDREAFNEPWQPITLAPARLRSSRHSAWDAAALTDTVSELQDPWSILSTESRRLIEKSQTERHTRVHDSSADAEDSLVEFLAPAEGLSLSWQSAAGLRSFGLRNLGNTCYANAVLQALLHSPPLVSSLLSGDHQSEHEPGSPFDATRALTCLCKQMQVTRPSNANLLAPSDIVRNLPTICRRYRVGKQEDAHEFLRYFIDCMANASSRCNRSPSKRSPNNELMASESDVHGGTLVTRIFGGLLRNRIVCQECQHVSQRTERFLDLSLDVRQAASVPKSLERFTASEMLTGRNRYSCPRCRCHRDAEKRLCIRRAPVVLTLHLKRFIAHRKLSGFISYPEWLDLRPYMVEEFDGGPILYQLYSVIIHEGHSLHSGHYYAYVRSPSGTWLRCNDEHLSRVAVGVALVQPAYLLFYLRSASPSNGCSVEAAGALPASGRSEYVHSSSGTSSSLATNTQQKRTRVFSDQSGP